MLDMEIREISSDVPVLPLNNCTIYSDITPKRVHAHYLKT